MVQLIAVTHWGRIIQSALAGLVFTGVALFVTLWQAKNLMEEDASSRLQHASSVVESSLVGAYIASIYLGSAFDKPCKQAELELEQQVINSPEIRSISMAAGNLIYCNSSRGDVEQPLALNTFVDGKIKLIDGDELTPGNPIILYRIPHGFNHIIVELHGQYLLNTLNLLSKNSALSLVVGDRRWLSGQHPTNESFPVKSPGYIEHQSTKYPFRIITRYSNQQLAQFFWQQAKAGVMVFPLLGMLLCFLVYRLTGRLNSPVREMQVALSKREFIPYLQPVVFGSEGELDGCEVLVRWQHAQLGIIPPDRFIPMAEASGLIVPMTRSLMDQVLAGLLPYQNCLPEKFAFGFNISACHIRDLSLVEDCRRFFDAFREKRIVLVLELTERELLVADEMTDRVFAELRELGVKIAIDDFGTGNSSLTYLQQFKVDLLKIDRSFVSPIGTDALACHIVDNVIDLATRLDLKVVAEGVETKAQADHLYERKVHLQQGYYHGRPVPMADFINQWLQPEAPVVVAAQPE